MEILIVEDDMALSLNIAESLTSWGNRAEHVRTGKEALKRIGQKYFDLVLLDIFLPDCRGYKLIKQFRQMWPEINVVAMTAHNSRELETQIRKEGVIYYMIKPFELEQIQDILNHISNKKEKEGHVEDV
jgi:DNA-binding NtrC family response regulator